jgi:hypothetical protein
MARCSVLVDGGFDPGQRTWSAGAVLVEEPMAYAQWGRGGDGSTDAERQAVLLGLEALRHVSAPGQPSELIADQMEWLAKLESSERKLRVLGEERWWRALHRSERDALARILPSLFKLAARAAPAAVALTHKAATAYADAHAWPPHVVASQAIRWQRLGRLPLLETRRRVGSGAAEDLAQQLRSLQLVVQWDAPQVGRATARCLAPHHASVQRFRAFFLRCTETSHCPWCRLDGSEKAHMRRRGQELLRE